MAMEAASGLSLPSAEEMLATAKASAQAGDLDGALDLLAHAAIEFPTHVDASGHPAFQKEATALLLEHGRWNEARAIAPKKNSPDQATWHELLFAHAYSRDEDPKTAIVWWRKVARSQPASPDLQPWLDRIPRLDEPFASLAARVASFQLDVIFDVGANVGQSSIGYARMFPGAAIHSFEPVPTTFAKLVSNTSDLKNGFRHNIALGDTSGELFMSGVAESTMNRVQDGTQTDSIRVPAMRLEDFCAENAIESVDFLKIDTEGFDLNVLRGCGAFMKNISFIQCEASANDYNRFHNSYFDIYRYLADCGFYLFQIFGQTPEWGNGGRYPILRRFDAVFVNKTVVGDLTGLIVQ